MQGLIQERENRNDTVAHFMGRLEGKLNNIHVKHHSKLSEADDQWHLWDIMFHGLWKHLCKALRVKYEDPLLNHVDLMQAARKVETEYEHDKHNNSFYNYLIKSGMVVDDPEGPSVRDDSAEQEAQWAKLIDMQEQFQKLLLGAKTSHITIQAATLGIQSMPKTSTAGDILEDASQQVLEAPPLELTSCQWHLW